MTTSAYPALTEAEKIFKLLIWNPLIAGGETYLEIQFPFLALPVVKELDEAAINAITDALYSQMVLFVDVTAIKLVNAELQAKWSDASESLVLIASEQGTDSDAYKKALSDAASDFAKFVHTGP